MQKKEHVGGPSACLKYPESPTSTFPASYYFALLTMFLKMSLFFLGKFHAFNGLDLSRPMMSKDPSEALRMIPKRALSQPTDPGHYQRRQPGSTEASEAA